jgi:hypothetical protein
MSTPVNSQIVLLRTRIPVLIGSITALNAPVQFGVSETSSYRGQLTLVVPSGVTTATTVLEASIDNAASWFVITATASIYTLTGQFTGDTAPIIANRYDVSGMSGAQFRFGFTAQTGLTTATVWGLIG